MKKKNLGLVVFNDISKKGAGFESDHNEISVINRKGKIVFQGKGTKNELASDVFDAIERILK